VSGWGEPVIEGRARTVQAAVDELSEYVIGQDPSRINDIWQTLYRGGFYRGGPILMSAIAGIDQALWDIKGKVLGAPVYQLLGGLVRDRMKMYSWVGGDRPADVIANIRKLQAIGFDTFKLNGCEEMGLIDNSRALSMRRWRWWPKFAPSSATPSNSGWISMVVLRRRWRAYSSRSLSPTGRCSSKSRCWLSRRSTTHAWPR
jgi:hypothetical protein